MRRPRLRVAYFILHLSLLSQVFCPQVESGPAAGHGIKDQLQSTTYSSSLTLKAGDTWRNASHIVEPREGSSRLRRLTQNPSSQGGRDIFPCSLNESVMAAMHDEGKARWLIDDSILSVLDGNVQSIINCTSENDVILLKTQRTLRPQSTLTIPWNLTLSGYIEGNLIRNGTLTKAKDKVKLTCRANGPLIVTRYGNFQVHFKGTNDGLVPRTSSFALLNMLISGCDTDSDIILLKPSCTVTQSVGQVQLVYVDFTSNSVNGSGSLINGSRALCTELSLEDVEFNQNSCDGEGCVLLSSNSTLQDISVLRNRKAADSSDDCSMFSTQEGSQVHVKNMSAIQNRIRILYINDSTLTVDESLFEGNVIEQSFYRETGGGVVLVNRSSLSIRGSIFNSNYATHGGAIYANFSELDIEKSTLDGNSANYGKGGAIFIEHGEAFNLRSTLFIGNSAGEGGALHAALVSSTLRDCSFTGNRAPNAGACQFDNSMVDAEGILFDDNMAYQDWGGAIGMEGSTIRFNNSIFQNNIATLHGGAIGASFKCKLELDNMLFKSNNAGYQGGSFHLYALTEINISNSNFSGNRAFLGGAFFVASDSKIWLSSSSFNANKANSGGCISMETISSLNMSNTTFKQNFAEDKGGAILTSDSSILNLIFTNFTRNYAKQGGAIHTTSASSSIRDCKFIKNNASFGGACVFKDFSFVHVEQLIFEENHAYLESGGAIDINSNSTLYASNLTITGNEAKKNSGGISVRFGSFLNASTTYMVSNSAGNLSGGVGLFSDSSFLCYSCLFENNVAMDGGGLYVRSTNKSHSIVAQLQDCRFVSNSANANGGGLMFEGPLNNVQNLSQEKDSFNRIILLNTSFVENFAVKLGSAILTTNVEDVLVSCDYTRGRQKDFLDQDSLTWLYPINPKRLCKSWKGNLLEESRTHGVVGTFGKKLSLSMNSTESLGEIRLTINDTKGFVLENVASGKRLPVIGVTIVDAFGEGPAPTIPHLIRAIVNSSNEFFQGVLTINIDFGRGLLSNIIGFKDPKNYNVEIYPETSTIAESNLTIQVRSCIIGEEFIDGGTLCQKCDSVSYNFNVMKLRGCARCPDGATCEGRFIVPEDGYWHKGPCYANITQCIVEEACTDNNREGRLRQFSENFTDCDLSNENLTKYEQELCSEGYKGPLCGSCAKGFGVSGNLECLKCGFVLFSVLRFLVIVLYLFVGTILTIKGTLPIGARQLFRQDAMTPLLAAPNTSAMEEGTSSQVKEESQEGKSTHVNGQVQEDNATPHVANDEEQIMVPALSSKLAHGIAKAQGNLVETWKILINFFQVTSTAATMNVKWTKNMLRFFNTLSLLGATTINSISRPIDCMVALSSTNARVIWRYVLNILVPSIVITILSIYWGYRSLKRQRAARFFLRRFVLSVITVTYITYFDITQVAVGVFNCVNVYDGENYNSPSSTKYWIDDTSIECYKSTHLVLIGVSLALLTLVSVCFPLASSWALFKTKDEVQISTSRAHETLGLLCGPFKRRFVFWECVTMLKKALLSVIIVFSYSLGNQAQGLLISIVLVFFLSLHITCYPFEKDFNSLNYYESGSLLISCITYILVQFFNDASLSEDARTIVSVALIIFNGGYVLSMMFLVVRNLVRLAKAILLSNNVEVPDNISWISIGKLYLKNRKFFATNT